MYDNARAVLDTWLTGVNAADFDTVVNLYHEDAILLPTFSNRTMADRASIQGYFDQLGARSGVSVELHEPTLHSQHYNDRIEGIMGIYRWRFDVQGEPLSFEARFTLIADLHLPTPILHHHSSQVPRDLS